MKEEPCCERDTTTSSGDEDDLRCGICNLKFESESERNLHVLAHPQDSLTEGELLLRRKVFYKEVRKQQDQDEPRYGDGVKLSPPKAHHKPRRIYKPPSKRVGLTKIRMEDCLRCDACSCIYIDPQDYYKHMRNFHEKYNTVIPRTRRRSPVNEYRMVNVLPQIRKPTAPEVRPPPLNNPRTFKPLDTTFITESIIRQSIKSRWSKVVSERLTHSKRPRMAESISAAAEMGYDPNLKIKEEPTDEDMSYLLSQVEVKIKTEPPDDYGYQ